MKSSSMLHVDPDTPTELGGYWAVPTSVASSPPPGAPRPRAAEPVPGDHATPADRRGFPALLRLLLRSQLLRHAERRELTSDRHLLHRLQPFLSHLDMAALHRGLGLLMEEDAHACRPFLAALVCEQRGKRPWAGFSQANRRLGVTTHPDRPHDTSEGEWLRAVDQAYRFYGRDQPLGRC